MSSQDWQRVCAHFEEYQAVERARVLCRRGIERRVLRGVKRQKGRMVVGSKCDEVEYLRKLKAGR